MAQSLANSRKQIRRASSTLRLDMASSASNILTNLANSQKNSRNKTSPKIPVPMGGIGVGMYQQGQQPAAFHVTSHQMSSQTSSSHTTSSEPLTATFGPPNPKLERCFSNPERATSNGIAVQQHAQSMQTPRQCHSPTTLDQPLTPHRSLASPSDWHQTIAIEERMNVREKLRTAYKSNCMSYEELIDVVAAIDEELLYGSATTRLDYFKGAIDWDNRLKIKKKLLHQATRKRHQQHQQNHQSNGISENCNASKRSKRS